MVNTATSNEQHHHHHEHEQQNLLHHPEPLNDPSGILSNSPNFASVNGIQIFEPIYQPNIAEKNLKVASVTLPNGHKRDFHIHKNSKGNVLFDLAAESETLLEKDYFGLRYEDELGEMTWLYPDKRIQKQLKHKPWNFVFQIKFYPPEPSALADDLTRYLLYLQIRKEIYEGKLPASYAKQILLAAMVMQAEIGDFEAIKQSPNDYERFLREQHLIPQIDEEVLTKVRLTPNEAHQKYLDTAKDLAKYGFTFFNAKDTKNGPVIIGIYAHGICVYKDQLQIHRFLWQGVNKIQFRGNKFSVVLKPGELDPKKEVTVSYRLADYTTAKKLYRTVIRSLGKKNILIFFRVKIFEFFYRLIKPEDKPKGTFLRRWGSDRFRYQGRTYFQAKMASQMFDHPSQVVTIQRTPSGRQVSRSVDDLAQQPRSFPTSPMHYVDETTQQLTSPEKSKSYSLSASKADKAKKKAEEILPLFYKNLIIITVMIFIVPLWL
uniref:Moesin/ezrin/radixin homolog 1 n=1 Tax=Panagrolaimus sp. PS1159 TaxID=55785 RepID=A0AC35FZ58_9BILA